MDKEIEIRDLDGTMLDAAARLVAGYTRPDGWEPDHLKACRANLERLLGLPGTRILVACRRGQAAGFIALFWGFSTSTGQPVLHVQSLHTAPAHQRTGIARALLRRAAELARGRGANRLQLDTDEDNLAARSLYESEGFELLPRKRVYMRFL